ncbi:hypothetical protein V1504DRAFT_442903 [Lipomyces starkeyi]
MDSTPSTTPRSEDEILANYNRKRTARACDSCYKKKIKCDAAIPQCNWCKHHNLLCTFNRLVKPIRKRNSGEFKQRREMQLADRIERIEKLLSERLPTGESGTFGSNFTPGNLQTITNIPPSIYPSFGKLQFAGFKFGEIYSYNGVPFFSPEGNRWVQTRTGQTGALEKLCAFGPPWQNQRNFHTFPGNNQMLQSTIELPDREIVEEYVLGFSSDLLSLVFPLIDPVLFEETIKLAYNSGNTDPVGHCSAKACIYSFLAFVSIFNLHSRTRTRPPVDTEACVSKALSLLTQVLQETTIDSLQSVVMLLIFHLFTGNQQYAVFTNSIAVRYLFMLGAHTQSHAATAGQTLSSMNVVARTGNHIRNLFWVTYTLDKELSLRTGQPPSLNDEHCDLTLPPGYVEQLYSDLPLKLPSTDVLRGPLLPGDLRLTRINSRAYIALYSAQALKKSDTELLKDIRELDDDLERWRMSLPPKIRPTISFSHETPIGSDMDMQAVIIRLGYHHCVATIHKASGRCRAWAGGQSRVMEGVSSSLALAVEASRSSIFYLQTAQHALPDESFWMILFYPMSAILTIFCNILLNPLDPRAAEDLELIYRAPDLIKRMPLRQLSLNELKHINLVDDFVAEMSRLAQCAIIKAREENTT